MNLSWNFIIMLLKKKSHGVWGKQSSSFDSSGWVKE
jgi:hypothetical protein